MLLCAATAPATAAASLSRFLRAAPAHLPPPLYRPTSRRLRAGLRGSPRTISSDNDVFWQEPDDGFGSDYEGDDEEAVERRSGSPFSRLEAARQHEQELRREIESLLSPEERAILDQNETPDVRKYHHQNGIRFIATRWRCIFLSWTGFWTVVLTLIYLINVSGSGWFHPSS